VPAQVYAELTPVESEYEPGAFYKRELPCILSLLAKIDLSAVEAIMVDGYVVLDDAGKAGLGGYLFEALARKIPVIGVAKTNFAQNERSKIALLRGSSERPLFITAMGIDLATAAEYIRQMHGEFRMPALLRFLDGQTKG
jgi:deoxyinosine 3'endonuclease (endonuclease V)